MRRRLFGRSHESATSILHSSPRSKEAPSQSPTQWDIPDKESKDKDSVTDLRETSSTKDTGRRHARSRKSVDTKHSDRLSIFGTAFAGTLGKSRKPPPRFVSEFIFSGVSFSSFSVLGNLAVTKV